MYTAFAAVYDRLMRDVDYEAWARHYARLLAGAHVHGGNVCECACGTGSLTLPLRRLGYRMTGVDLSRDMLSQAAQPARDAGLEIPFVCQDMCHLQLHRRQDAILCTCDGVNYLTTPDRARHFFRAAYAQLKPGGALIFDVSTPEKLSGTLGDHTLGCRKRISAISGKTHIIRAPARWICAYPFLWAIRMGAISAWRKPKLSALIRWRN